MTPDDALKAPITEVAAAIRAGRLSSADLVARCIENIEARDGALKAFVHIAGDALDQARRCDDAARSGASTGPLHGIPIAIKDNYLTADMPTTAGTAAQIAFPLEDGAAVARLRAAGAILIGKTRMHEFAWGMETPPTTNPYDETRVPGGSSGGSGAAVTAGFCLAATGSDTGGSIRIPASLCGNVGFKPTFGRIGRSGIVPHSWSLDHAGPLARNVADAALLVDIMSGHDPKDAGSAEAGPTDLSAALTQDAKGLRVGVCRNHFFEALDPQVERAVENTIALLGRLGATVVEFEVRELQYGLGAIFAIELSSSTAYHLPHLSAGRVDAYAPDVRLLVEMGRLVTGSDYLQAERYRTLLGRRFREVFANVDVVVGPTMPITAWRIGQKEVVLGGKTEAVLETSWRFTYPWNLLGLPAITVPCGFDDGGLPIGFQIAGAAFDEASVVRTASLVERHTAS
ncbi:Asp-tRNA(Asn)/Glu-tRNA(Gln) amidotransferase GatCAB subunit A [Jiella sp. KSK16Y-1]|uniref:Asp-tRNA(Asn)/Glu-tRNA(Gln) amidotransferase GatCAB subunit A n=1 Tax=Jiella mangrovi TaxID=2821407 RepID=A0ABS4BMD4_9HYPH|nr:amidase [Jiella mangrovi]MBP0617897.1 Asp-tRNA(Asn)/Glu-tRNA(Gln) amidotransferase GatCAB subunit A [Jiella mangrovi]